MKQKRTRLQRVLSLLIAATLFLSQAPVLPARAAQYDTLGEETRSYYDDDQAVLADNFSGALIKLVQSDPSDSRLTDNIVRLDFGLTNPKYPSDTMQLLLRYDTGAVAMKRLGTSGGTFAADLTQSNTSSSTIPQRALVPLKFQESMLADGIDEANKEAALGSYIFQNSGI